MRVGWEVDTDIRLLRVHSQQQLTGYSCLQMPMDNHEGVEVPELWLEWFRTVDNATMARAMECMWQLATGDEKELVARDLHYFVIDDEAGRGEVEDGVSELRI